MSHTSAHTMPMAPETTNEVRQPQANTSQPTNSAPKPTPKDCPSEIADIARPYSDRGAQARTVLVPTGQAAASPVPRQIRAASSAPIPVTAAVEAVASDQNATAPGASTRVPKRSAR